MECIDIERLKKDLEDELMGAFCIDGFGGAFIEAVNISKMTDEEIIEIAKANGIDVSTYFD